MNQTHYILNPNINTSLVCLSVRWWPINKKIIKSANFVCYCFYIKVEIEEKPSV